jgi:hypothetical protein
MVENAFSGVGSIAFVGWGCLITHVLMGQKIRWLGWLSGFVIPALLSIAYIVFILRGQSAFETGGYDSFEAVKSLFQNDQLLLAGWIHYLTFDLFLGAWIARDAYQKSVSKWVILPILPAVFLFGPAGLLFYLMVSFASEKFFAKGEV